MGAVGAGFLVSGRVPMSIVEKALPGALFLVFFFWQLFPIILASQGAFLDMRRLLVYLRPHLGMVAVAFVAIVGGALVDLLQPWLTARAIDTYIAQRDLAGLRMIAMAGIAAIVIGTRDATLVLACAWFGAAAGRTISAFIDRSWSKENLAGIAIEVVVGSLLLVGA